MLRCGRCCLCFCSRSAATQGSARHSATRSQPPSLCGFRAHPVGDRAIPSRKISVERAGKQTSASEYKTVNQNGANPEHRKTSTQENQNRGEQRRTERGVGKVEEHIVHRGGDGDRHRNRSYRLRRRQSQAKAPQESGTAVSSSGAVPGCTVLGGSPGGRWRAPARRRMTTSPG